MHATHYSARDGLCWSRAPPPRQKPPARQIALVAEVKRQAKLLQPDRLTSCQACPGILNKVQIDRRRNQLLTAVKFWQFKSAALTIAVKSPNRGECPKSWTSNRNQRLLLPGMSPVWKNRTVQWNIELLGIRCTDGL